MGNAVERGKLVGRVLAGSWREPPGSLELSPAQLRTVTPILLATGSAGLGWWRIRNTELGQCSAGLQLRDAFRLHALQAALYESQIREATSLLGARGIETILVKGWAMARLYPAPGLRPYGDIDLLVRKADHETAQALLTGPSAPKPLYVDLHSSFSFAEDRSFDALYGRCRSARLKGLEVRVLSAEDHLRLLCLHLLKHGLSRPPWLCDIGLALESCPPEFDWDLCFHGNAQRADWVACVINLAHEILGARAPESSAVARRSNNLPSWLVPAVLQEWGLGRTPDTRTAMSYLRDPRGMIEGIRARWPNAILATVLLRRDFDDRPRVPLRIGAFAQKSMVLFRDLLSSTTPNRPRG